MDDQEWSDAQLAERIATYLFVNGNSEHADRLVLTAKDGRDLGGWCERAVVNVILDHIRKMR